MFFVVDVDILTTFRVVALYAPDYLTNNTTARKLLYQCTKLSKIVWWYFGKEEVDFLQSLFLNLFDEELLRGGGLFRGVIM